MTSVAAGAPHMRSRANTLGVSGIVAVGILILVLIAAIGGEHLTRYGSTTGIGTAGRLLQPSADHILGTDAYSRDVLDRLIVGTRSTLIIAFLSTVLACLLGALLGMCAALLPRADGPIMRVLDGLMAFPSVFLAIGIIAMFGSGKPQIIVALSVVYFPRVARVVRGAALTVGTHPYVEGGYPYGG